MSAPDQKVLSEGEKVEISQLDGGLDEKTEQVVDAKLQDAEHTTLIEEALALREEESKLGLLALIKLYYPGMVFSMLLTLALVMEGMDTGLINNFFAHPAYKQRFGVLDASGNKIIPSNWQAGINNGSSCGQILGLLLNGWAQPKFGYRRTYMAAHVAMTATIFVLFFAQSLPMLLVGNILCGIPWGVFQVITTSYAAEIVPPALRGFLTTWVSMCWGMGGFLASGILRASLQVKGDTAWRIPYGLQWVWPLPLFIAAYFAPESPFWLVRVERYDEAKSVICRIARKGHRTERMCDAQIEIMREANEMEKVSAKNSSYADCFRGNNLRRTIIGVACWLIQIWAGGGVGSYATVFLTNAGMAATQAFNFNMGISSTNIVSTAIAMYAIGRVGRRPYYLIGVAVMGVTMFLTGIVGSIHTNNTAIAIAVMLIIGNISFKLFLGPCCYTIIAEVPSSRVRNQTMVIGRASYVASGFVINQLTPRMLNADAWNWGAKSGYFYFAFDVIFFIYLFFHLPETRNRTTAEIEYMFAHKVPARQFKRYQIDPYDIAHMHQEGAIVDAAVPDVENVRSRV